LIGAKLGDVIRAAADAGHEIGLHAWDHHAWQTRLDRMTGEDITKELARGVETLGGILGHPPICSAAPGWKCNESVLLAKEQFAFIYNSDCRGASIFRPTVNGRVLDQPQIPADCPTYDEVVGRDGISVETFNVYLLSQLKSEGLNILTIHAEVEGIALTSTFDEFVSLARSRGAEIGPLGSLLSRVSSIPTGTMLPQKIPGREGWVSCQTE